MAESPSVIKWKPAANRNLPRVARAQETQEGRLLCIPVNLDSMTVICHNTVMITTPDSELTLEDLTAQVDQLLANLGLMQHQPDNRVSASPDGRTIRYYTTLGLLERPSIQGRQAIYGRRHILQLLAIKCLQLSSLPLSEIQSRLYALSDSELESLIESVAAATTSENRLVLKAVRPTVWKEIVIEPGLKLMAEDGWLTTTDSVSLDNKIRAAILSLQIASRQAHGG